MIYAKFRTFTQYDLERRDGTVLSDAEDSA
jgi:hypothetical protein